MSREAATNGTPLPAEGAAGNASRRAPPGLAEGPCLPPAGVVAEAASKVRASVSEGIEEKVSRLSNNGLSRAEVIEAIREVVVRDVEEKVNDKAKELWQRGEKALVQLQQRHMDKTNVLSDEVTRCRERQRTLESENESLKKALASVASRFSLLGAVFGQAGCTAAGGPEGALATALAGADAFSMPEDVVGTPTSKPAQGFATPSDDGAPNTEGNGKLAEVPPFPLQQTPTAATGCSDCPPSPVVAPLLLAEVIGQHTPQRTPLSLANSLTPGGTPEAARAAAVAHAALGTGAVFSFTLRKADGAELGLNVSHHEDDRVLRVEGVRPDGAVEAWNRQCAGGASAEKAVLPGDKIISVNSIVYDPTKMLEECRDRQLLRLTVVRESAASGDKAEDATASTPSPPSPAKTPGTPTVLRADASVFVPMASATTPLPAAAEVGAAEATPAAASAQPAVDCQSV